jgi:hypothetical protein
MIILQPRGGFPIDCLPIDYAVSVPRVWDAACGGCLVGRVDHHKLPKLPSSLGTSNTTSDTSNFRSLLLIIQAIY